MNRRYDRLKRNLLLARRQIAERSNDKDKYKRIDEINKKLY